MEYESVIGLEVHAQLQTQSKIFSGAATAYGAEPNTQACAVDLGLPGVLPVLNKKAVEMAVKFGVSVGAHINHQSIFARKNYFYPDLPKGYQISQFEIPIVGQGSLNIILEDGQEKTIGITRAHLEEDAGKSLHEDFQGLTGIDLNRAGTPLLEIVSEPDMRSAKEAIAYLKTLHALVRAIDICDGNMQEGSFRCDANVSIRPVGQTTLGTRCEIKNVNSFKFVEKAINYEIERQKYLLESGQAIQQQTRLYDANKNETRPMRSKEEANDYRYFPDPDLLPLVVDEVMINDIKAKLPELPSQKRQRFCEQYGLSAYDSACLTENKTLAEYFETVHQSTQADAKCVANWVMGDLMGYLNKNNIDFSDNPISTSALAQLLDRIADQTLSGKTAKAVFEILFENPDQSPDTIIEQKGLKQVTDLSTIEKIVQEIIDQNPSQWQELKDGKDKLQGFFVGQVMKQSQGKANPGMVNKILKEKLSQ